VLISKLLRKLGLVPREDLIAALRERDAAILSLVKAVQELRETKKDKRKPNGVQG
jgi:hypothetical protein